MLTLAYGEFIGALVVAALAGGVLASLWAADAHREAEQAILDHAAKDGEHLFRVGREEGLRMAVATARDDILSGVRELPRLHCSRSASGHVRLAEVERMLLADGPHEA